MSRLLSVLRLLAIGGSFTLLVACGGGDGGGDAAGVGGGNGGSARAVGVTPPSTDDESTDPLEPVDETPPEGPATGVAQLSWLAPEANADGSALNVLTGYRIRYGKAEGALDQTIEIENPSLLTYTVEKLTPGTWYFEVVAVNESELEGPPSNTASKVIS